MVEQETDGFSLTVRAGVKLFLEFESRNGTRGCEDEPLRCLECDQYL